MRNHRLLLLVVLSAFLAVATAAAQDTTATEATTVFLVRHAEKAKEPKDDPPLNEAGVARAQELARVVGQSGIGVIYVSQFRRTKETAAPAAAALGLTPVVVPMEPKKSDPGGVARESISALVDSIRSHPGRTALVVGHSNTLPQVMLALGGVDVPAIGNDDYDDLFVVTLLPGGGAEVSRVRYGRSP